MEPDKILREHSLEDGVGLWCHDGGMRSEKRSMLESGYIWLPHPITIGNPNTITEPDTPFLIDTDGRVGIGTTSPSYKIDVINEFNPLMGVSSRYAERIVNNDFYGTVNVSDLNTFTDSATEE